MADHKYHVWYVRESDLPDIVKLAYEARIAQPVNHLIFSDWSDKESQKPQCERSVKAAYEDKHTRITVVKKDDNGEIVAFSITKRNLALLSAPENAAPAAGIPSVRFALPGDDATVNTPVQYMPKPILKRMPGQIAYGAVEPGPSQYLNAGFNEVGTGQVNAPQESFQTTQAVPPTTPYRNLPWVDNARPGYDIRALYAAAHEHMANLEHAMRGENFLECEYVWVKPEHRGKGIGKRLVENCIEQALSECLSLYVRSEPSAIDFFLRFEFAERIRFTLDLARYAPRESGYGKFRSAWMLWSPSS